MKNTFIILFLFLCSIAKAQTLKNCSTCSTQIIKSDQINDLSIDEIRYLTNDLFAIKGYVFKSSDVNNYYSSIKWYKPTADNKKIIYNNIEKQNIKLFQDKTSEIKNDRENFIRELKNFKVAVMNDDKLFLMAKFNYSINNNDYKEQFDYLKKSLEKINLDDINWSFGKGIYNVNVDNGEIIMNYKIELSKYGFYIKYGNQGGSEIGKQIYPNDQITEYTFLWNFEWKNRKLTFLKMDMAG